MFTVEPETWLRDSVVAIEYAASFPPAPLVFRAEYEAPRARLVRPPELDSDDGPPGRSFLLACLSIAPTGLVTGVSISTPPIEDIVQGLAGPESAGSRGPLADLQERIQGKASPATLLPRYGVREEVRPPALLDRVQPEYPEAARQARIEGRVEVEAIIDTEGRVTDIEVIRSVPGLDEAAVRAVCCWRYRPATLHGAPVNVYATFVVDFDLE